MPPTARGSPRAICSPLQSLFGIPVGYEGTKTRSHLATSPALRERDFSHIGVAVCYFAHRGCDRQEGIPSQLSSFHPLRLSLVYHSLLLHSRGAFPLSTLCSAFFESLRICPCYETIKQCYTRKLWGLRLRAQFRNQICQPPCYEPTLNAMSSTAPTSFTFFFACIHVEKIVEEYSSVVRLVDPVAFSGSWNKELNR